MGQQSGQLEREFWPFSLILLPPFDANERDREFYFSFLYYFILFFVANEVMNN